MGDTYQSATGMCRFPAPQAVAGQMVSFQDVSFGYPGGPTLFRNLDFGLDMESRLAIVGANGQPLCSLLPFLAASKRAQQLSRPCTLHLGLLSRRETWVT